MSDLTDPLWGTGYGSKRHLVDEATIGVAVNCRAFSRCGGPDSGRVALDFLAGSPSPVTVESRPPCARCQKIADRQAQS